MKFLSILFLSIAGIFTANAESEPTGYYKVISDVYSESVPSGSCILKGYAIDKDTKSGIAGATVGETNRIRYTTTNEDGKFKVNLSAKDSSFYFYHPNYDELICWNYNFKNKHIVTVKFVSSERVYLDITPTEKPVIYLYSESEVNAEISLKPKGTLAFTYPKYDDGWNVNVSENGLKVNDSDYPYLFWDGESQDLNFSLSTAESLGYFIKTDSTIAFLESTLSALGLNSTEMTDFITYWGPRITAHDYATVQFLVGEEYDKQIAELAISTKPDSQLRIYMLFQGTEYSTPPQNIGVPKLPTFKRNGFTLVEWGGSELKPIQLTALMNPSLMK